MSLLPRLCLMLALAGLASGCQPAGMATGPGDVTANAVTGDAIEVTALDVPSSDMVATGALTTATPQAAPPAGAPPAASVPMPPDVPAAVEAPAAAVDPAEALPPPAPKSDRQIACERKRSTWADTGGGLMVCIRTTRDGGQRCSRESQCEGLCLARSGTCAPADPMIGCHEILQDDGSRATQCIE